MVTKANAVAYIRVSTAIQVEGYSLDAQLGEINRYAFRNDLDVIKVYDDKGKSGKNIESRPRFLEMIEDIEADRIQVKYVIVYKLSRFGRNSADVLTSLQKLQKKGVNLICTGDGLDSSTPIGKLMITVFSAVAESERVNILEQTMSGRTQKAREGKRNGGFAPYGYQLKNGELEVNEEEAEAIRIIFSKFIETDLGYNGVTKYLNRQGILKIPRKNGKLTRWSSKFVSDILDNPVYCGMSAYGRRKKVLKTEAEKTQEEKDKKIDIYHLKKQDTYILEHGIHRAIISMEDWEKVRAKRSETGGKSPSKVGRDRVHLLSGIIRCPECGGPLYSNKNNVERKGSGVQEVYYYACSRAKQERGSICSYRMSYRKDDIEAIVINEIRKMVNNQEFASQIKYLIGKEVDTSEIDKELQNYKKSLMQCEAVRRTLEIEIDTISFDDPHRERKLIDRNVRLDMQYTELFELEEKIDDLIKRRQAVEANALNLEQVYQLLLNFDSFYDKMSDEEQRKMVSKIVKEVEVYKKSNRRDKSRLRSISFSFPVMFNNEIGDKVLWDNETHVETVVLMSKVK